ncbi:MAG: leucyl aminopeptidase family protein [Bdellovibrionales bacterium]|nr:leucyl aminopeptidase family protein [Bdellovibrionales bacterium]
MAKKSRSSDPLFLKNAEASWVEAALLKSSQKASNSLSRARFLIFSQKTKPSYLKTVLSDFEWNEVFSSSETTFEFLHQEEWIYVRKIEVSSTTSDLSESLYASIRNGMGAFFSRVSQRKPELLEVHIDDSRGEVIKGALVGLDIAAYKFTERCSESPHPWLPRLMLKVKNKTPNAKWVQESRALAKGINIARHLVSLPPNELNPQNYALAMKSFFEKSSSVKVTVWDSKKLAQEKMGLILGVGQAAEHPPCMIHLRYRPNGSGNKKPIALVGKGITFDSGGLDLKPANFMRWMKKDMGGSATVVGTLRWAEQSGLKRPLDVYLAVAENAVSSNAFRPGDILTARNGKRVEIQNTDAEGRLVLAEVIDVAISQKGKDQPEKLIDVATLTGAIKAALGSDVAGLFSNNQKLRDQLVKASETTSDYCWPVPLFQPYFSQLKSSVSDFMNSSDGMGGAITAALFLQKFVGDIPWAHFDIYAFTDGPQGALREKGGNGQVVQLLSEYLS